MLPPTAKSSEARARIWNCGLEGLLRRVNSAWSSTNLKTVSKMALRRDQDRPGYVDVTHASAAPTYSFCGAIIDNTASSRASLVSGEVIGPFWQTDLHSLSQRLESFLFTHQIVSVSRSAPAPVSLNLISSKSCKAVC